MYIDIQKLKKTFGTQTAIDIDKLHIADGQRIGVVGNNGAGKTTLFRLLLDLLKADEGNVTLSFSVARATLADNAQTSAEHTQTSPHVVSINPAPTKNGSATQVPSSTAVFSSTFSRLKNISTSLQPCAHSPLRCWPNALNVSSIL